MSFKIAIDGPVAAGKSTVAKELAKELGYVYIDTGALYRAVGLYLIKNNIDYNDESKVIDVLDKITVDIKYVDGVQNVLLNGKVVDKEIRSSEVSNAASVSSAYKKVREKLLGLQRNIANENSCVMDGRDIGSKVLPDANIKIYLTASIDCRAKRRLDDYIKKGINDSLDKVKKEIIERDNRDMNRAIDPLIKVEDAILVDNTDMTLSETLDKILLLIDGNGKMYA